tara:strand:- start:8693 stop:9436 length:744 start_codon:yes stop_codon:yes gene_type:complete
MLLKDKVAVVTGANRGIGLSITELFALNGADIFACVRNVEKDFQARVNKIKNSSNVNINSIELQLDDHLSIKKATKEINNLTDRIDILINNAGIAHGSIFQMLKTESLDELLDINFKSQLLLTQGLLRKMVKNKAGSIVNIGSTAGILGDKGTTGYGSSKAALMYASRVIANEVGRYNIRSNSIAPGVTKTDMFDQIDEKALNSSIERTPLNRVAEPEEIANVALFLASDLSSFITGQTIRVDGGII